MSLTCVNKVKTCTGCMTCQDETPAVEEEIISEDEREEAYESLDVLKSMLMHMYNLKEYQAIEVIRDYTYAQ